MTRQPYPGFVEASKTTSLCGRKSADTLGGNLQILCKAVHDKVTLNAIMGVTTMDALQMTSFAGEEEECMRDVELLLLAIDISSLPYGQ